MKDVPKTTWVFPKIGDKNPKWMVKNHGTTPFKMDDLGGDIPLFSEPSNNPTSRVTELPAFLLATDASLGEMEGPRDSNLPIQNPCVGTKVNKNEVFINNNEVY